MKPLLLIAILGIFISCQSASTQASLTENMDVEEVQPDTLLRVYNMQIDSVPFVVLQMNPEVAYISMADSVMPSEKDSLVALCVEAAFTGELLKEFKTTNIGGDYVIDGVFHKGYKCKANTGFLYADKSIYTISSSEHCKEWIAKAEKNNGSLFQQILIVQNGKNVYRGTPIKPTTSNIYRGACILNDGNFAVIQSLKSLPLKDFINLLMRMGVSDALYLDMGRGWNYGWYRETVETSAIKLFDYKTPYQTNWLIIRAKQ